MNTSDTNQDATDKIDQPEAPQAQDQPPPQQNWQQYRPGDEPFYRPLQGRLIAGVAAGIAQYLGVDVAIVRIVLAVLTVIGGAGVPVYVAGWLLIPDEGARQSIASELIGSLQGRLN
jgi:phage shock protein PspC (stress-responsive transcriptional regulator)